MREGAGEIVGDGFEPFGPLIDFAPQDFTIQVLLGAEAVVEHSLVDAGAPGDRVDPSAGETACRKLGECRVEDLLARAVEIANDCTCASHDSELTGQLILVLTDQLIRGVKGGVGTKAGMRLEREGTTRRARVAYHFSLNGRTSTSCDHALRS